MISIKNLTKDFVSGKEEFTAIDNISLDVNKGEIFGIVGLSGAGKSTLVRCINRLEEPTKGKIFIEDRDITTMNKRALRETRKNIGMIFQHFNLLHQKTVFDNIAISLEFAGVEKAKITSRVTELLSYVELSDKRDSYPSQLSGGQKQRVAIARAIANNPKILLSDEATSALDPHTTSTILNLLKRIRNEFGITIIMITHQMEVVKEICDRVAIMEDGKIIETNSVEELFKQPQTKTASKFINSLQSNIEEEIIDIEDFNGKIIRLSYLGESAKSPILSNAVKKFAIQVNILSGNINKLQSNNVGHLILEIDGDDEEVSQSIQYLKSHNVNVEVIK